ncbi:hypothetical protein BDN72DRAFT_654757 [Pluteus cervinus]|uniref:Uncharacterized protein n=1 Tax=Pluteus cervinus TaxID=181527 RepID=A0ACD3AT96_9AGAR|nr:hypothetical protein BDN72DRAFT_654757 [Pluteus cervinus]
MVTKALTARAQNRGWDPSLTKRNGNRMTLAFHLSVMMRLCPEQQVEIELTIQHITFPVRFSAIGIYFVFFTRFLASGLRVFNAWSVGRGPFFL